MLVATHQSHYLPWLRHLDKIHRSDVFVVLARIAHRIPTTTADKAAVLYQTGGSA